MRKKVVVNSEMAKKAFVLAMEEKYPDLRILIKEVIVKDKSGSCYCERKDDLFDFSIEATFEPITAGDGKGGKICVTSIRNRQEVRHPRSFYARLSVEDAYQRMMEKMAIYDSHKAVKKVSRKKVLTEIV